MDGERETSKNTEGENRHMTETERGEVRLAERWGEKETEKREMYIHAGYAGNETILTTQCNPIKPFKTRPRIKPRCTHIFFFIDLHSTIHNMIKRYKNIH